MTTIPASRDRKNTTDMNKQKYESEVWAPGFGVEGDRGFFHVEYLPDGRAILTSHKFVANEHDRLKVNPVTVETVEDMRALDLGRNLIAHMKGERNDNR